MIPITHICIFIPELDTRRFHYNSNKPWHRLLVPMEEKQYSNIILDCEYVWTQKRPNECVFRLPACRYHDVKEKKHTSHLQLCLRFCFYEKVITAVNSINYATWVYQGSISSCTIGRKFLIFTKGRWLEQTHNK